MVIIHTKGLTMIKKKKGIKSIKSNHTDGKRKTYVRLLLMLSMLVIGALSLAGCGKEASKGVEAAETKTEAVEKKRVIALSKSNAELWLLAGGELIATSEDALVLEGLGENVESLGDMDHVSLEAVAALEPDYLILFSTDPAQKALGEAAQEIGIPVRFTNIDNFGDYEEVMREFTGLTGREDLYQENVAKVKEGINGIKDKAAKAGDGADENDPEKTPGNEKSITGKTYLLLHVSATKSKAEKNDYFASEILNDLGLINIAADDSAFKELSMEAILGADPDYIFVIPRGDEKKALKSLEESFTGNPSWESLSAVKNGHFSILSKDLFGLKPNNRWDEAYEEAYRLLYQ